MRPEREVLFAVAAPGLEPVLEREARALAGHARVLRGGVELAGPPGLHQEANLRLRTATRVLLRLADFPQAQLERALPSVDLAPYWDGKRPMRVRCAGSVQVLKQAAAGAWPTAQLAGEGEDEGGQELALFLRTEGSRCTVSVDTTGEPLYRRGYRQELSRAPLRETLAAAILLLAGYQGDEPLWDPMCGSGTFLIEAAWLALGRAPGVARPFSFQQWPAFDPESWGRRLAAARAGERAQPPSPLRGSDLNAGALGVARRNAKRAGVERFLQLERADVAALRTELPPGLVVVNPPYGHRVGEGELPKIYDALARALRGPFARWRAAVLVPRGPLLEALDLGPGVRVHALQNGGIPCVLAVREPRSGSP